VKEIFLRRWINISAVCWWGIPRISFTHYLC
jgi:hypothetical protein